MKRTDAENTLPSHLQREKTVVIDWNEIPTPYQQTETLIRHVPMISWQESTSARTQQRTYTAFLVVNVIALEVEPIVKAVYEDNLERFKWLYLNQSTRLLFITQHIINERENATLLDIAASRKACKCLAFFREILQMTQPDNTLEQLACHTMYTNNREQEQYVPHIEVATLSAQAEHSLLYRRLKVPLKNLYAIARQQAYTIAKNNGYMQIAALLTPIPSNQ